MRGVDVSSPEYTKGITYKEMLTGQVMRVVQALVLAYINDRDTQPNYESIKKRLQPTDNEKFVRKIIKYLEEADWSAKNHITNIQKRKHPTWKLEKVE